jgi:RNA polymerase sigma factor (sigma-70 family)
VGKESMTRSEVYALVEEHYRANAKTLFKILGARFGNHADAEEVVQEAYTRCCQYWDSYEGRSKFNTWFNQILNNCSRDKFADIMRMGMVVEEDPNNRIVLNVGPFNLQLQEVEKKIRSKKPHHQRILFLYFANNYDPQDIVKIVPENLEVVKKTIWRFQNDLKASSN